MRHEEKFICSQRELFLLESRVKNLLPKDSHQTGDDYLIRSIYFDTAHDRMLQESLQGLERRSKFRIRTYNCSRSSIHLEKKTSFGQLKSKVSCDMSYEDVVNIANGRYDSMVSDHTSSLMKEFVYLQNSEMLMPKIIVEYDRSAYVGYDGNVRITFDRHISGSSEVQRFFDQDLQTIPVLPNNAGVLEVKYDGILSGSIARALNVSSLHRISFSKYGLCRNIIDNNGRIEEYYEF